MKQLLILSGKGGTGKTTVAAAFIRLAAAKAYGDCDVDAPNLHLVTAQSTELERTDYFGMPKARIDHEICTGCGLCRENCRFDAILQRDGFDTDRFACEGCGVCEVICPVHAIRMEPAIAGELNLYRNPETVFSTAILKTGSGTSGKLVTEVKKQLLKNMYPDTELIVIDGSPGIGCPVIASLSGVDMVLIVAEPSVSGIKDMKRIIETARIFRTRIGVCINKHDTNPVKSEAIEEYCAGEGIPFAGRIPFDRAAVEAINRQMTIADVDCPSGTAVRKVFSQTMKILTSEKEGANL